MKLAVSAGTGCDDHVDVVRKMTKCLARQDDQQTTILDLGSCAIGLVSGAGAESELCRLRRGANGNVLAVAGVPVLAGRLADVLDRAVSARGDDLAELLGELGGAFEILHWDAEKQCLHAVSDFVGMQPFYWTRQDGRLAMASEIQAFSRSGLVEVVPDPAGWGAFLAIGHTIGAKTQLRGVLRTRGEVLRYDPGTDKLHQETRWTPPPRGADVTPGQMDTGALLSVLDEDVRGHAEHVERSTLMLTGGFDSRLILCLLKRNRIHAELTVVQHPGHFSGAEAHLACQAAERITGERVQVVHPHPGFYKSPGYLRYLTQNEVATPSLSLFIAPVTDVVESSAGGVWDGLGFGISLAPHSYGSFDAYRAHAVSPPDGKCWQSARRVFRPSFVDEMREAFYEQLDEEVQGYEDSLYGTALFSYRNRALNRTGPNPLKVLANRVTPLIPGHQPELWSWQRDLLRCGGFDEHAVHCLLFNRHFPEAMDVPFCSESGVFPGRRTTPWVRAVNLFGEASYYWGRVRSLVGLSKLFRPRAQSGIVPALLDRVWLEDEYLDVDGVRGLLRQSTGADRSVREANRMAFYWTAWQEVMSGRLTYRNAHECLGHGVY